MAASQFRHDLPQLADRLFITDGGIETTLIFHEGLELPDFAAFHLFKARGRRERAARYFRTLRATSRERHGVGLVLESATWRASADWGDAARLLRRRPRRCQPRRDRHCSSSSRASTETSERPMVISGCVGPRGDGYDPSCRHVGGTRRRPTTPPQIETFADTAADLVTAITMNYVEEAIGIARAARRAGMPVVISFTVETDGRLPTGQTLQEAIEQVDAATTERAAPTT